MTKDERDELVDQLEFTYEHSMCQPKGGQQVAMSPKGIRAEHRELGFAIFIGYHRSQHENRAACITLFELFLDLLR